MKTSHPVDAPRAGPSSAPARRGLSLLEMMIATTIMATLMASVVVVMRSGYAVWNAQEADIDTLENAYAVVRHFAQQMRQADSVTVISDPSDTTGNLSFLAADGATRSWSHDGVQKEITFDNGASSGLLARSIDALTFTGYEADGVTQTTAVDDIQVVKCEVQVTLPQGAGVTRTVSCQAWIRSW
jgi:prepilin-type N-terminal cleavage/methylation domain-containing protein